MHLFRFEHRAKPIASPAAFVTRLTYNVLIALLMLAIALGIGMAGYHFVAQLGWLDSFLNAAMLLGGMGPVTTLENADAKLFAGLYALFCGIFVVLTSGIVLAPILHRVLHVLHAESEQS